MKREEKKVIIDLQRKGLLIMQEDVKKPPRCASSISGGIVPDSQIIKVMTPAEINEFYDKGNRYYWGDGVEADLRKAILYIKKAAGLGHVEAMYDMGLFYMNGTIVSKNKRWCLEWLSKAAMHGSTRALVVLGSVYEKGELVERDLEKVVEYYGNAVEAEDYLAMLLLAPYYEEGTVVEQNVERALELYEQAYDYFLDAAGDGDAEAQFRMGNIHHFGIPLLDIVTDDKVAAEWYELAAKQGYEGAQINLSQLYALGSGVEQSYAKAAYWMQKAAERQNALALGNLANAYVLGRGVEQDYAKAAALYAKAANMNFPNAQVELGKLYEKGLGVEQNAVQALLWYSRAADNGARDAYCRLGDCYRRGFGVECDVVRALEYYERGAKEEDLEAQIRLAQAFIEGWGTDVDCRKAIKILSKLCSEEQRYRDELVTEVSYETEQGWLFVENPLDPIRLKYYARAYYMLALLYYSGGGIEKNNSEAIRLLRMAEKFGFEPEEEHEETTAQLLKKIVKNASHEEIRDSVDCSVEVRECRTTGEEKFDVFLHHADGTDTKVEFRGRNKFVYLLLLMIAYKGNTVSGLTSRHFYLIHDVLAELADTMCVDVFYFGRWVDEFVYIEKEESKSQRKGDVAIFSYDSSKYSNAISSANRSVKEVCRNELECKLFSIVSTRGRNSISHISIDSSQVVLPDALLGFVDMLPTTEEIASCVPLRTKEMVTREKLMKE